MGMMMYNSKRCSKRAPCWRRLILFFLLLCLWGVQPSARAEPSLQAGEMAAPNPLSVTTPSTSFEPSALPEYGRGYTPHTANVDHLSAVYHEPLPSLAQTLPTRWDWRNQGAVAGVRNQGECGACYAFAGIGSLESQLLIRGEGAWDLSEGNVRDCSYEQAGCVGGHIWIVANQLSRRGAVSESCDPYVPFDAACNTACPSVKIVDQVWILGDSTVPPTALLKSWLYAYGPLYVTMDSGASSATWETMFRLYDGSYTLYRPGSYSLDHAVLLVGWDDSLQHSGGQGAWLVKNSWGTGWGNGGYFSMAYGSAGLGSDAAALMGWHNPEPAGVLLHHDEGGWQREYGWRGQLRAHAMVRFVPTTSGCIEQIELWTTDRTRRVAVSIYDTFNGYTSSGLLRQLPETSFDHAGYHKIDVSPPLAVTADNDIHVMVSIENHSYWAAVPIDNLGPTQAGRSYVSPNGAPGSWLDLGSQGADVAVRARMAQCAATATPTPTASVTPSQTPTDTHTPTPTGPTSTPLPKVPRVWMPLLLRQHQVVPTVTPTPMPPTIPPTVIPAWTLAYAHDYDLPDGLWIEQSDSEYRVQYLGGEYQIKVQSPYVMIASRPGLHDQDYAIEVEARAAAYPWGLYGILFGADRWGNGYFYRVDGSGRFSLRAREGDAWDWLVEWTASPYVYGGVTPNRLRVERVGDTFRLFANGYHLATVTDDRFSGNTEFGLTASAQELVPVDVRFDRFRLYKPTGNKVVSPDLGSATSRGLAGQQVSPGAVDVAAERH
jgi:C1A family cysteine protease